MSEAKVTLKEVYEIVSRLEGKIDSQLRDFSENYVTKERFAPVEKIVYGFVTLILLSVVGALVALVVKP